MKGRKKLSKRIIALICAGAFILALGVTLLGFYIGYFMCDAAAYVWRPDYEQLSEKQLKEIYDKDKLTDGDYEVLFKQTGLTKIGIQRAKQKSNGWETVKKIQEVYFAEHTPDPDEYFPLVCTDYMKDDVARLIYLEQGDILIGSSTHFSGFRIGHAAIVTNSSGVIYQSNQVGVSNGFSTAANMFANRTNFMVLRIKPEYFSESGTDDESYRQNLARVTEYISTQFDDVSYSVFTGVFTKKDSMKNTSCAHLLWYGFKHFDDENGGRFNLDLDSNGRLLVMPKNISESPYVELVQTFGFNPDKMYE